MRRRTFLRAGAGGILGAAAGCAAAGRLSLDEARIWDLHCHLREDGSTSPEDLMAHLIGYADRMVVERLIFLSFGHKDSTPEQVVKVNDRYLRGLEKRHPRALGFVFVNPNRVENGLREMDRCVRDGPMVGVKLHVSLASRSRTPRTSGVRSALRPACASTTSRSRSSAFCGGFARLTMLSPSMAKRCSRELLQICCSRAAPLLRTPPTGPRQ